MHDPTRTNGDIRLGRTYRALSAVFNGGLARLEVAARWLRRLRGTLAGVAPGGASHDKVDASNVDEPLQRTHTAQPPDLPEELKRSDLSEWDAVDEASWESFPASDPPTGWAGRDIKPPTTNGE